MVQKEAQEFLLTFNQDPENYGLHSAIWSIPEFLAAFDYGVQFACLLDESVKFTAFEYIFA